MGSCAGALTARLRTESTGRQVQVQVQVPVPCGPSPCWQAQRNLPTLGSIALQPTRKPATRSPVRCSGTEAIFPRPPQPSDIVPFSWGHHDTPPPALKPRDSLFHDPNSQPRAAELLAVEFHVNIPLFFRNFTIRVSAGRCFLGRPCLLLVVYFFFPLCSF